MAKRGLDVVISLPEIGKDGQCRGVAVQPAEAQARLSARRGKAARTARKKVRG